MLIVDTDPGTDDAVAIMMLLASGTSVDAFVSVYGNVPLKNTTVNLQYILDLCHEDTALRFQGCASPLLGDPVTATEVHGEDGLSGAYMGGSAHHASLPQVDYADLIRSADEEDVTILALGPLTNIGRLLAGAPDLVNRIAKIIVMGGAAQTWGNTTPAATFNIVNDPTAAAIVYESGVPIVQVGLDVCRDANIDATRLMAFQDSKTDASRFLWHLFNNHHMVSGSGSLTPDSEIRFNDAPCVAYLIRPDLFTWEHVAVGIETEGRLSRGATVADFGGVTGRNRNTDVLLTIDVEGYNRFLTEMLTFYM